MKNSLKFTTLLILTVISAVGCSNPSKDNEFNQVKEAELKLNAVNGISHAHGLAVDANDSRKVYIATHNGLLILKDDKALYRVGDIQDDFMGFSAHPKKSKIFFTSGHPKRGGNMGIQRSDDEGMSWTKLSDGVSGPVDFHSMTLSPANPNIMYGWYGALQKSTDGGRNWGVVPASIQKIISLTADPQDENTVYATTANGLYSSADQGKTWSAFTEDLSSGVVTALAIDPSNKQNMLSFSESLGLAKSVNGGTTWDPVSQNPGIILYLAFAPNAPGTAYALNKDNILYKSTNGGDAWEQIFPGAADRD